MRSLPAALLSLACAAPVLSSAPAVAIPAVSHAVASHSVAAHPVATTVRELALPGVNPAAHHAPDAVTGPAISRPAVLTRPIGTAAFQTLGVTWTAVPVEPDLVISVRTHSATGWSAWVGLDDDAGDDDTVAGPGVRGGTDPLWVGPSDGVQTRIVVVSGVLPANLKLELVNPGSSQYDAAATATVGATVGGATSAGGLSEPLILSRAAWGADESRVRN